MRDRSADAGHTAVLIIGDSLPPELVIPRENSEVQALQKNKSNSMPKTYLKRSPDSGFPLMLRRDA
jgi:hypothetical protein